MNYKNYEREIVEKFSVAIQGWPLRGCVCNPSEIKGGNQPLREVLAALNSRACRWVKLTEAELEERKNKNAEREARGEKVYHHRKSKKGQFTSPDEIDDGSEEAA